MDANDVLAVAERALTGREPATALDSLAATRELLRVVEARHQQAILTARAAGHTWQDIGTALGTTKQGALSAWNRATAGTRRRITAK